MEWPSEDKGCKYATAVLGVDKMKCEENCPFPFCVVVEAHLTRSQLMKNAARIMYDINKSVEKTAEQLGVSLKSVYRYVYRNSDTGCTWCNAVQSNNTPTRILCKSNTYTVVNSAGQLFVILNRHGHATVYEHNLVKDFIEYVFPDSSYRENDGGHDYWSLSRVPLEEAKRFDNMCASLNKYALNKVA